MENQSNIHGNQNIVIQGVTDSTITLSVNGQTQEVLNKLNALQALLEKLQTSTFQSADKTYHINGLTETNFDFLLGQVTHDYKLPIDLSENLIVDRNHWVQSLRQELLLRKRVSVKGNPKEVFQHYGWLIEEPLRKMYVEMEKRTLRLLSFMAMTFHNSLRYLCYIQMAQILGLNIQPNNLCLAEFIELEGSQSSRFDYLYMLLTITNLLKDQKMFVPEIDDLVYSLTDTKHDLYSTSLFLEKYSNKILTNNLIVENTLDQLLDEYLTALVFWLRQISFLSAYRLVSMKDINLNYRLGTPRNFVHLYGELHGVYKGQANFDEDYSEYSIEKYYTYNQSVLLFKGSNIEACLEKIEIAPPLSLSPLIIDKSVYSDNGVKQTPEIYYYTGKVSRQYSFSHYQNEMAYGGQQTIHSNKALYVKQTNIKEPKLDELFVQIEKLFRPFKN